MRSREGNLLKNTLIITIGKVCTQLISFFLLPLYTTVLSTKEYGIVDLLNTLVSLLLPIVTFQVEQAVFRELIEVREDNIEKKKLISSTFFSVIIQCIIYILIFFTISTLIDNEYKYFLATNVIVYIFSSLFLQIARGLGENTKYAIGSFISALSTIIFNLIFILGLNLKANGMLLGTMLGQITCALYLFIFLKIYKYLDIKLLRKKMVLKLWKYSLPLIPNAISWWVFNASDRVIVSGILGISQNGILAASLKFSMVYITFYNVFNISWTESISRSINDVDISTYFNKMFNIILNLFITMAVGMIACMPFIYPIMINKNYITGYGLVPISIIASLFNVVVGLISVIYVGKKNTKAIANTSIISAIINIIVHLSLIKFIGLYAAVVSTFISFFIMSIYRLYDINKKYFKIKINKKIIIETTIILIIILFTYYLNNLYLNIFSVTLALVFAWFINKNSISTIINLLKRKFNRNEVS